MPERTGAQLDGRLDRVAGVVDDGPLPACREPEEIGKNEIEEVGVLSECSESTGIEPRTTYGRIGFRESMHDRDAVECRPGSVAELLLEWM